MVVPRQTNFHDIVQTSNKRVAILDPRRHDSFSITSHQKNTCFRIIWNLGHLYLILLAVVRKGTAAAWRCLVPRTRRIFSEALHEDAVIIIALSYNKKEKK
jgi:hypothetical protein